MALHSTDFYIAEIPKSHITLCEIRIEVYIPGRNSMISYIIRDDSKFWSEAKIPRPDRNDLIATQDYLDERAARRGLIESLAHKIAFALYNELERERDG